jgi:hypothetical protein
MIIAMGFKPDDIVDDGTRFVVQGDMLFYKDQLRGIKAGEEGGAAHSGDTRLTPPGVKMQWVVNHWAHRRNPDGNYHVDLSGIAGNPAYLAAVRSAMQQWNAIPEANTSFTEGTGAEAIHVVGGTCPSGVACAALPINGHIGSPLTITSGLDGFAAGQQLFMMVHELGHAMGMLHTDWTYWGEPAYGNPFKVPGTPDFDSESVMNKNTGGWYFTAFTNGDRRTAALTNIRYFSGTYSPSGPTASWPAQPEALYYHVEEYYQWYVEDEWGFPQNQSGYIVVGDVTETSIALPPAVYDGKCAYQVIVRGVYASGGQTYAYIPVLDPTPCPF